MVVAVAMDLFMHDLFDVAVPAERYVVGGRLQLDDVLDSPALAANLAFHQAWSAVLGMRPTRADFAAFAARAPGAPGAPPDVGALAAWGAATSGALAASIVDGTAVRVLSNAKQLVEKAADVYQRALASTAAGAADAARRGRVLALLLAKLADRFGAAAAAGGCGGDVARLPAAYAALVLSDASLPRLERWACLAGVASGGAGPGAPPATVGEYYERVRAAAGALGLPLRSPVTGFDVAAPEAARASLSSGALSALESVRYPLMHDLYLWRRDAGGSILLSSPGDAAGSDAIASAAGAPGCPGCPEPFRIRHVRGPPPALLLAALPSMYARVVVDGADADDEAAARSAKAAARFADVVLARPSVSVADDWPGRLLEVAAVPGGGAAAVAGRYWVPTADAPFGAPERAPRWAPALASAMLQAHLLHGCALSAPGGARERPAADASGALLLHDFVARYAARRALGRRVFATAPPGQHGRTGEVVLIDSRANVWSALAVLVTLDNLRAADWSLLVLCGERNEAFMREALLPHVPHARFEVLPELSGGALDIEAYNVLLKSAALWRRLARDGRVARVLTVQDDGMLALPGLDDDAAMLAQDFLGAPWTRAQDAYRRLMEDAGVDAGFVGNGGLSLRNPAAMLEICEAEQARLARTLFNNNLQPLPEDVFFAVALARRGRAPPRELAARFAFEAELPGAPDASALAPAQQLPLGFHKPWPYSPAGDVADAFARLLAAREEV